MSMLSFIQAQSKLIESREIIFFAGSFNPWHQGHSVCLEFAPKETPVIIAPDHNPFKELTTKENKLTSLSELHKIAKKNKMFYLFDGFLKSDSKNPTHSWLVPLAKKLKKNKFSLLLGFDTFLNLETWIKYEDVISSLFKIYVVSRNNDQLQAKLLNKKYHKINPLLKIEFFGPHNFEHLSSRSLREVLKKPN